MLKISQLAKFTQELNPQSSAARLAFSNFVSFYPFESDELTLQTIELFFAHAMDYPHWQQNKQMLSKEVRFVLENFSHLFSID
jgi:hypothetical protein